jgi:TolB-like protein
MRKFLFCIFLLFASAVLFAQQPMVAVTPFNAISGISAADANMITRVFFIRLGNTAKVGLVDRTIVEQVLREHNFQTGDWSNQQKTAELGKALNADWVVRGELEKFGSNILVTVQFYDIRTFRFMGGADLRLANADEAYDKMDPLVDKLVATIAGNPSQATYNIGDRGPGGGFIFFAESGVYLECSMDIGTYSWDQAVSAAENHRGGGFTDWRFPSDGEFRLMYQNLAKNKLGGFSTVYWTSKEHNRRRAWAFIFDAKNLYYYNYYNKTDKHSVRAVRSFSQ